MTDIAKKRTLSLILCAVFAALSAVLSTVKIWIGPVPVGVVHLSVFLAAGLLGSKKAALSQAVFVSVGLSGVLPIFAASGLAGPTGGFIIGYIPAAFVTGAVIEKLKSKSPPLLMLAMYAGWLVAYGIGVPWFMLVTGSGLRTALAQCVLPFLLGDLVKTIVSAALIRRLSAIFNKNIFFSE